MARKTLGLLILAMIIVTFWTGTVYASGPTQLKIITSPQIINANATSSVITVETQDDLGILTNATSTTHVNLSSDSVTGTFSSKSASECGDDWTISQITIASGNAHKSFCYKDSTAGTHTITVSDSADILSSDTQTITINSLVATLTSIAITASPTKTVYIVGESFDIAGLEVTGTYSDSSTQSEQIGYPDVTGFDSSVPVTSQVLTVTFGGQTATFTVDIVMTPVTSTPPIVEPTDGSHSSGYLPGWGPNGQISNPATSQVLGASTSKRADLARQRKIRQIKRKFNHLRVQFYDFEHPQANSVVINPMTEEVEASSTDSTSSPQAIPVTKPFWKFW